MDGLAVCERIRALPHGRDLPIIFLTAQRDVETFDRAFIWELGLRAQTASVKLERTGPPVSLAADPSLLRRVIENLVENAIRHAPEQSTVTISVGRTEDGARLAVTDHGVGVAEDLRSKIFEPFLQLEHGERIVERTGRGLGLTFCKVAVEAHGGRIWIESANPGAAFCVSLPDGP